MYKILNENTILRIKDNSCIPINEGNMDYQQYLKWLSEGNKPLPLYNQQEIKEKKIEDNKKKAATLLAETDFIDLYSNRSRIKNITEMDMYRIELQRIRIKPTDDAIFPDKPKVIWK